MNNAAQLTDETSVKAANNGANGKATHLQSTQILDKKLYKVNSDKDTINSIEFGGMKKK